SANQKALDVLHAGFKNKPELDYYKAGDLPTLPDDLAAAGLTAQILGPPIDAALIGQMTRKSQQYLAEAAGGEDGPVAPFADAFRAVSSDYPAEAFELFDPGEIAQ